MSKNGAGRKLKLLFADDNPDTIRLMTMLLQIASGRPSNPRDQSLDTRSAPWPKRS